MNVDSLRSWFPLSKINWKMNVTPDLEFSKVLALEVMDQTELALYGEFLEMCKSGCNFDQIAQLMGEETCRAVLAAMKPADDEYKRLIGYSDDQGL